MATGISYYNNAVQANADYVFGALPPASTNGASPFIPPMQAFWVQTTATGSLTIDNTARVVNPDLAPYNAPTFYRLGGNKASTIKLAVSNGTVRDEAIVRFAEIANDSMESEFDMRKVRNDGNTPSLFSKISGTDYSINSMGENFENKIIPLGLEVKTSGIYKINTIELYDFDDEISVVLEDRVLGKMTDLKADSSYNFYINNTDTTSRFFIHFQNPVITKIGENNINGITISQNLKDIVIDFGNFKNKNAIITISNSKGQILLNEVKSANLVEVKYAMESFGTNIYFVNVKVEDKNYTKKIEISSGN